MNTKYKLLQKCILFDLIGMSSYFIPVAGSFLDLLWAPFASAQMTKMFPGRKGKIAALIVFLEEISMFDFIPTFTLMWVYTYVWKKENTFVKLELQG